MQERAWILVATWAAVYVVATLRGPLSAWTHALVFAVLLWSVYAFRLPALVRGDATHAAARRQRFVDDVLRPTKYQKETNQVPLQMRPREGTAPIRYIPWHPELVEALSELHAARRWDATHYDEAVGLLERFLAVYYRALDRPTPADAARDFPIVRDIRRELLNTLGSMITNVPHMSHRAAHARMDLQVSRILQRIQGFTRERLRLLAGWIRRGSRTAGDSLRYTPPWPANEMDRMYGLY